jgi:hypothetical protein
MGSYQLRVERSLPWEMTGSSRPTPAGQASPKRPLKVQPSGHCPPLVACEVDIADTALLPVRGSYNLMVGRRNLLLAWLAVTLTALAPVFAYTHIHVGANGEIIENCAADEAADTDAHDHSNSNKGMVPHCPYCPGFSAGAALAQDVLPPAQPVVISTASSCAPIAARVGRASLRIAQQRAPPSVS